MKIFNKLNTFIESNSKKLLLFFVILPLIISLKIIITGNFAFWYDPARDLLSALNNIDKISLIGPPSGIPGIFYGPFWIWFLSIALLINKNPRFVVFFVSTIPYLILFPIFLNTLSKSFSKGTILLIWTLFIFGSGIGIITSIWNPNLAPLFLLIIISLVTNNQNNNLNKLLLTGIFLGLLLNFHLSLGISITFGVIVFYISNLYKNINKKCLISLFRNLTTIGIGILLMFVPFLIFEARHGFNQIKTFVDAVSRMGGGIVGQVGFSKFGIITHFFGKINDIFQLKNEAISGIIQIILLTFLIKKSRKEKNIEKIRLLKLLLSLIFAILFVYLTAKNPIWGYHFIGIEVILLLTIGFIFEYYKNIKNIFYIWTMIIVFVVIVNQTKGLLSNDKSSSSLKNMEDIVKIIENNASKKDYTVFAYNQSIYTYDYSFLFQSLVNKKVPYDPGIISKDSDLSYLIIPPKTPKIKRRDFINYNTDNNIYITTKTWNISDGTEIIKRERK